ncbi:MAG: Asp-tRNA(Asn)/Glu-tRNA(Gln) amidotransferase subunit GatA [Myxococcales bacterium]|nr:Asp-tRNA(Asn)/Glu-tRNA(Gln) amidotransferase subunit GatA [Myxococcales bacterium]
MASETQTVEALVAGQSVRAQAEAVRTGRVRARSLVDAYLARIERLDPQLGTYLRVNGEGARRAAEAVDSQVAQGQTPGPLAGVPLGIKDIFVTKGIETTCASKILAGFVPPYEGTATSRLQDAGAINLGKLNMDEFAMGSSNENSAFKPVRNPWDPARVPGGSSGGSAAAVAANLCAASLGTDTGGSIRQPAAFCGVSGIKPTYGRVSRYGVIAFASSLDHPGPFGRAAVDVAALLEVMAGADPRDATSLAAPVGAYVDACEAGDVTGLRIGMPAEYFQAGMDPEVESAVRAAIDRFGAAGARIVPVSLPHTSYAIATYYLVCTAEASSNLARYDGVKYGHRTETAGSLEELYGRSRDEGFGDEPKRRIVLGTYVLRSGYYDAYYGQAQRVRRLIANDFAAAFASCDLLVTPTTPMTAFKLGEKTSDPLQMYLADIYTVAPALAGVPALALPCGLSSQGLPIGMQLIGPTLGEATLFRAAGAYQKLTDWHERRAPLAG